MAQKAEHSLLSFRRIRQLTRHRAHGEYERAIGTEKDRPERANREKLDQKKKELKSEVKQLVELKKKEIHDKMKKKSN